MIFRTKYIFSAAYRPIPMVNNFNAMKYLGHQLSISGVLKSLLANLPTWLERLSKVRLKPLQKLMLSKEHVTPPLMYSLQSPAITFAFLTGCDRLIKRFAKCALLSSIYGMYTSILRYTTVVSVFKTFDAWCSAYSRSGFLRTR